MPPPQAGEAAEVSIAGDQLTSALERERGEVGIRHEVAACAGPDAQALEDLPVTRTRTNVHDVRLVAEGVGEQESLLDRCGRGEDARVGRDAEEATEHEIADPNWLVARQSAGQPRAIAVMILSALVVRRNEDVDVEEDQRSPASMCSRRVALSSRSIPGRSRLPANVGSGGA